MSKTKNMVIDQMNQEKQESDFMKAVNDLQAVSLETLDRLHSAAHEAIAQLQGDLRLPDAAGKYAVIGPLLTVEMVAFKAYAVKYNKQNENK